MQATGRGKPAVRRRDDGTVKASNVDEVSPGFSRILDALKIRRRGVGFYSLRHTLPTWADETRDQHAVHCIMGHALPGMSGIYMEEISLEHLRAVVEHVRRKLFSSR